MDVQKYIKRLKFARADMSRATGPFETYDEAINFLNSREFFFGDPFVVKYKDRDDNGETKLLLAIGKSENPAIGPETTEVTGGMGPEAYELFDLNGVKDEIEKLWEALNEEISARTETDEHLQEEIDDLKDAIDAINEIIGEISGATEDLKEIVGDGWTDSPDNVTITDRLKRDEELAGIYWGHKDGEPYDGHLPETELPYASGESISDMIETISDTLDKVLFEDDGEVKTVKLDYNPERNILYYTAGTQTGEIQLSQASIVERGYYDSETEELVIIFILGEGKRQEVRIPVGSLITEWETVDTDTVHLERERVTGGGPDRLSADVKVSDDADNMLVAKADGLHVSNSAITALDNFADNIKEVLKVAEDGHFIEGSFTGEHTQGLSNYRDAVNALDAAMTSDKAELKQDIADTNAALANVKETADKAESDLTNVKDVLRLAEDGHFIQGSFTGPHTSGLDNYCDAINALDGAITNVETSAATLSDNVDDLREDLIEGLAASKTEVKLDQSASHLTLDERLGEDGHAIYVIGENDIASETDMLALGDRCNDIQAELDEEESHRESINLRQLTQAEIDSLGLGDNVREAYYLCDYRQNPPTLEDTIVKIYKDSVIYRIYFGHVDDQLVSPTDPTVIEGTGDTAICFIYFDANGDYALSTNKFDATDVLWEAVEELQRVVEEGQEVTAIALNRLAEAIVSLTGDVEALGTRTDNLESGLAETNSNLSNLSEEFSDFQDATTTAIGNLIESDRQKVFGVENPTAYAVTLEKVSSDEGWVIRGDVKVSVDGHNMITRKSDGSLFVDDAEVIRANEHADALDASVSGLTDRMSSAETNIHDLQTGLTRTNDIIGPGFNTTTITDVLGSGWTGDSSVRHAIDHLQNNVTLVSAVTEALKGTDNSFQLVYDPDRQEIILKWEVDGVEKTSRVDASDFVKDSFLDGVQVVNREGVKYLEFKFKTYDGEPVPIYVPLTDLAVIYKDGDGIDREALEEDQIITVKLDEVAQKNWLAKSPNGLRVTGITEAIDEAIENLHIEDYVRKDEVEDHLDSASTLPVQNKVVTEALNGLRNDITTLGDNYLSGVTIEGEGNVVTGISKNGNDVVAHLAYADFDVETATTTQYGVVILDDHLSTASTNPVENKVITEKMLELEDSISDVLDAAANSFTAATYDSASTELVFTRSNGEQIRVDASPFTKDGMVDTVYLSGSTLVITFNADAGKPDIEVPLSGAFNPDDYYKKTEVDELLDGKSDTGHTHTIPDVDGLQEALDGKSDTGHTHTVSDVTGLEDALNGKSDTGHTHTMSDVDGLEDALDGKSDTGHTHTIPDVDGLQEALDGKSDTGHTHTMSDVDGLEDALDNISATTVYAETYYNLPTATTTEYGMVIVDDALSTASTNPVENKVITETIIKDELVVAAGFNDLEDRKADKFELELLEDEIYGIEDVMLTGLTVSGAGNVVTELHKSGPDLFVTYGNVQPGEGGVSEEVFSTFTASTINNVAGSGTGNVITSITKSGDDLVATYGNVNVDGFLPLSGGTMTGDISGETGVAIYMPGGFFQQSDERLKIFLGDVDNALAQVKEIPTKYFYWKEMCDGPRQIGTSAQKVKEVVPEVVSGDDVLSVDYSKLSIVALAAIKELAAKVEDLQKQIDELKK